MEYTLTYWTPPDAEHKLIITFEDETTKEYTQADKDQYLADYPDRAADVVAMGWATEVSDAEVSDAEVSDAEVPSE